uniref:Uncharacterized protein n=1 Tax=Rhizophora mucronata TaxID=61149 RepID=A0A2P2QPH0_RHIMU
MRFHASEIQKILLIVHHENHVHSFALFPFIINKRNNLQHIVVPKEASINEH